MAAPHAAGLGVVDGTEAFLFPIFSGSALRLVAAIAPMWLRSLPHVATSRVVLFCGHWGVVYLLHCPKYSTLAT